MMGVLPTIVVLLTCIFSSLCINCVCCSKKQTIDSLQILESLSELALLRHHPQSIQQDNININKSFESLVKDLKSQNLTFENEVRNCSTNFKNLPEVFCQDGALSKCLSVDEMLDMIPETTRSVSEALARLCPLLLLQLHSEACTKNAPINKAQLRPNSTAVWGYGLLFVTIISACSLVGVIILPLLSKNIYHTVLMLFEGLAVGSLAGSSLFHLIPQTFHLIGQDIKHDYLWKSLIIFGGIYLFYLSERLMKIFIDVREQRKKLITSTLETENSTEPLKPSPDLPLPHKDSLHNGFSDHDGDKVSLTNGNLPVHSTKSLNVQNGFVYLNGKATKETTLEKYKSCDTDLNGHGHHHDHAVHMGKSTVSTVAWMIIFGDGLHNFIDGLSIGAAFSESILAGVSISVAVVCEEFPHELGDFAVLLSAGMTMRQALMYNFLSAITCYAGLVFGILLGDLAEGASYIFALAAGMFLYISLVDMMGELSEGIAEARKKGTAMQLKVLLIQNIGILLGVLILFVMARYAEHFNFVKLTNFEAAENTIEDHVQALYSGILESKQLHTSLYK